MVADTVPRFCNSFNVPLMKEIKLEPQEYTEWRNTFNVRQNNITSLTGTLCIPGTNSSTSWRGKFGPERGISGPVSATRSLDLIRQNLQNIINKEIDHVLSRYLEKYFHPAIENIKDNLGPESVSQDMLRKVCSQFLEDAKMMYISSPNFYCTPESQQSWKSAHIKSERNRSLKANSTTIVKSETKEKNEITITENSSLKNVNSSKRKSQISKCNNIELEGSKKRQKFGITPSLKVTAVTRKTSSTSSTDIIHYSKCKQGKDQQQARPLSSTDTFPIAPSNNTAPDFGGIGKMKSKDIGSGLPNPKWDSTKWQASRIVSQTLFVMGARANKALGFGQMRGRLYMKHPELFKYSGDQEDKEWLTRNNLMAPTGGKAYIMIVEDIRELAETEEYKNNPNLLLDEIHGFEVPDFMLKKIRCYVDNMRTGGSDFSLSSNPGKKYELIKAKIHNKLLPSLPVPGIISQSESIQPSSNERKILLTKENENKIRGISHTVKSILEKNLREDKSSFIAEVFPPSPCKISSSSCKNLSFSSSDNKITLKSLLESKTSYHIRDKCSKSE